MRESPLGATGGQLGADARNRPRHVVMITRRRMLSASAAIVAMAQPNPLPQTPRLPEAA